MKLPALRHYDVKMRKASTGSADSELHHDMTTSRDYLRFYYTDYLAIPLMEESKPKFADERSESIEIVELCRWISSVNPRTRLESYPLFVLCKDVLNRLATKELKIIDSEKAELMDLLAEYRNRIAELEKNLEDSHHQHREELDKLNQRWKQRLLDSSAETPRDEGELRLLREQLAASNRELSNREEELRESNSQLDKFTKELAKQKKEVASLKSQNTSLLEKIASMEQQLKAFKGGDMLDPLLKLDDNGKLDALRRLLVDDTLYRQAKFKNVLVETILIPPTKGIPVSIKKSLCLRLLSFIFESERGAGDDLTKLAIISSMLSSEEKPVMISELLKEAVEKDIPKMKHNEQVELLRVIMKWISSFKSDQRCVVEKSQDLIAEWGKGKEEISLKDLQPAMNEIGIPPIRSEQFFIDSAGDVWESVKIRSNDENIENPVDLLQTHFKLRHENLVELFQEEDTQWEYMVKKDDRMAVIWDMMRGIIERDFLDLTGREHPPKHGSLLSAIDNRINCKWIVRTMSRLFGADQDTVLTFFGQLLSTETFHLALKSDRRSRRLRKKLLRYFSSIIRGEKLPFSEWAFEVHVSRAERAAEQKALQDEHERRTKLQRPGTRNMSMYEGGRPTAVKTIAAQIGQIYESKVLLDETYDKTGKTREALPDFLKNFLIRQYGLKSIGNET
uniref:Uncharacterized protein n=1 Tax=Hanusia phi TaxID=3032 RepID=A0A7S0EGA7_9CRYP